MKNFIYSWITSFFCLIIIDAIWLSIMVPRFYKIYLSHVFTGSFNYWVAGIFYILYSFGIAYLIILPNIRVESNILEVILSGFILGLLAYGAYNLTNQATIKDWSYIVTLVDMLWGATITGLVSGIIYKVNLRFF